MLRSFWLSIAHPAASDIVRSLWGPLERQWRNSMTDLRVRAESRYVKRIFGCTSALIRSAAHSSAARAVP